MLDGNENIDARDDLLSWLKDIDGTRNRNNIKI